MDELLIDSRERFKFGKECPLEQFMVIHYLYKHYFTNAQCEAKKTNQTNKQTNKQTKTELRMAYMYQNGVQQVCTSLYGAILGHTTSFRTCQNCQILEPLLSKGVYYFFFFLLFKTHPPCQHG